MERAGEVIRRQKFIIEEGCHMRNSLIVVLDGAFTCTIAGTTYRAVGGDVCVFPEGVVFRRKVLTPIHCVYLQFSQYPVPLQAGKLVFPDPDRAKSNARYLANAVENKDEERIDHYLSDLFYLATPIRHTPDIRDEVVKRCIRYMDKAMAEPITLEALAEQENLSKQTLIRKFKACTGLTPMQYLANVRLNESKILLRDTSLNISQIAQACGFENVYYFSNFFRKSTGVSPSQYRKNLSL